jgi:hypothetical protein
MEGHDVHRPMTNARAEIGASEAAVPFREPHAAPPLGEADAIGEVPIARATPPSEHDLAHQQARAGAPLVRREGPRPAPESGHTNPQQPGHAPLSGPAIQGDPAGLDRGATAPQLRRFIKSRAYVPIHELRRRFGLNGNDDDVTPVDIDRIRVFVGLPDREGRLLGELLRAGDIGYELSMDPVSPIVVGVYPMRPVTRN